MASGIAARPIDILLAEDNPGDSRLAHEALSQSSVSARLHTVRDGVEAMAFLRGLDPFGGAPRPDLVFLDLNMPRKDGRAVLAEIKGDPELRRLPVVILSNSRAEEDLVSAYDLQASCFIRKPADWETFSRVFSAAVSFWVGSAVLPGGDGVAAGERTRILLIEDDKEDVRTVRQLLEAAPRSAFEVSVAGTLKEGLRVLEPGRFDAVLLDLSLPDALGPIALERVAARAPAIPVITLIPRAGEGDRAPAVSPEILRKEALDSAALVAAIREATERARWRNELGGAPHREPATGLPTRAVLLDRLGQAIERSRRHQGATAVFCLGLDRAPSSLPENGGAADDRVVQLAAARMGARLRGSDTMARIGSSEFGIVLEGIERAEVLPDIAAELQEILGRPAEAGGGAGWLSASIGASLHPTDGGEPAILLRRAETALRRAQMSGAGSFEPYSALELALAPGRGAMRDQLRLALRRDEFVLHYQPILDATGRCAGAEALLRWRHPEWGLLYPQQFLREAERSDLILDIGDWVLHAACAQGGHWQAAGRRPLRVAVNLSPRQLGESGRLFDALDSALGRSGLAPALLEVQIGDRAALRDEAEVRRTIREVHERGVQTSVNEFGSEVSSLGLLRDIPIDGVRIDRSFVSGVTRDPRDAALVETIITLAHGLRMTALAEGVETIDQLGFLLDHQIDQVQGHYIGRPAPPELCAALFDSAGAGRP